jgi:hypothetical protein
MCLQMNLLYLYIDVFFQALNLLIESFGLFKDLFPFLPIVDAGYLVSFGKCPVLCYPPICTWVFLVIFCFFCGASTQRGSWPPHS